MITVLIIAELAARMAFPEWRPARAEVNFWTYDPLLGWAHRPRQRGRLVHRDFSIQVNINSQGLRDDEYPLPRSAKRRMLILGDSFGWGFGVEYNERFSEILEKKHPNWEIINTSVCGYGTDQQLLYLRRNGLNFKPDVVLLLFCHNDFEDNSTPAQYWYNKPCFELFNDTLQLKNTPVPGATLLQKFDRLLLGQTYLYARIYSHLLAITGQSGQGSSKLARSEDGEESLSRKFRLTGRLIKAIHDLCGENGIQFILVSVPMRAGLKKEYLAETSIKEAISYLPLDGYFAPISEATSFPHDQHWNRHGNQVAAEAIERFLFASGVF
ncbi:MAG TPA: SGNH/GDSL hydrolase family protein [bacterium]|nr:SGNH/GDSL hydrolase family protein [bacterium]HPR87532.1 SGNH/GDSL hydrolase family protein [bacterium]